MDKQGEIFCEVWRLLAFEGDSHVEWFEGNFEDYEQDKIRRLGPDAINPHRMTYKRLTR